MLKSRNSFFSESNMNSVNYVNPTPNYYQMPTGQMGNIQASSASNSFYQGPAYQNPMYQGNINQGYDYSQTNDYDNRLAKIERSINRLDARITKLENKAQITTEEVNNTLYMV